MGVLDMLRFHKFTIGHAWCSDFGDPDKEEDFHYIYKYSPLHNIRPPVKGGSYPAVLLTTGMYTVTLNKMNLTMGATESFLASLNPFKFPVLWQSIKAKSAFQSSKGSTFEIYLTAIYCVPRLFWTFFGSKNQYEMAKP